MKRGKMLTSKKALLSGGLAIASTVLATIPALAQQSQSFDLTDKTNAGADDYPTVTVTVTETEAGSNAVTVNVQVNKGPTGYTGDLRAVWFDLPNAGDVTVTEVGGGPVTGIEGASNATRQGVSNNAGLNGMDASFNLGVEIGRQGIARGDDFQTATFTLDGVSLSAFTSEAVIGSRLMSVGDASNNRGLSSKTGSSSIEGNYDVAGGGTSGGDTSGGDTSGGDTSGGDTSGGDTSGGGDTAGGGSTGGGDTGGGIGDAQQVPEPMSVAGWLVGGGAIAAWRRRNKKRA